MKASLARRTRPRKPQAMETAEIERLLHTASANLPEQSPDLVARALNRALASEERRCPPESLPVAGSLRGAAYGVVVLAGIAALVVMIGVPPVPRLLAATVTPQAAKTAISPAVETSIALRISHTPRVVALPARVEIRHRSNQRTAWRHRARRNTSLLILTVSPVSAPGVIVPAPITPQNIVRHPSVRTVASAAPAPRPFWHDEQVERDDYALYTPVILVEETGQEAIALTPAVVQVGFSTTQPVADADVRSGSASPQSIESTDSLYDRK